MGVLSIHLSVERGARVSPLEGGKSLSIREWREESPLPLESGEWRLSPSISEIREWSLSLSIKEGRVAESLSPVENGESLPLESGE